MILVLVVVAGLVAVFWRRDPRSPQIAALLAVFIAIVFLLAIGQIPGSDFEVSVAAQWFVGVFVGIPIILLAGSMAIVLLPRDGDSSHENDVGQRLLPLAATIGILAFYGAITLYFASKWIELALVSVGLGLLGVIAIVGAYLILMACGYLLHAMLYTLASTGNDPDFISVNGGRLIDGDITTLLKSRLDRAIELYNQGGGRATILPSGGWTGDDTRSEADAMTEYLLAHAIPADQIVPEDQSTTTRENLENCRHIIELRSGLASPNVVFVTSNYHVYRTALIARSAGINCHGVGSGTPLHLLPEAILREIAALFWMHKLWHSIPILAITLYYQVAVLPSERY